MDQVPVAGASPVPPSTGEPLAAAVVDIMSPRPVSEAATQRPRGEGRSHVIHVVKPTLVTAPAVRSPVVRPQLVSVVRGQPRGRGARGPARVLPVVHLPAGSISAMSSLIVMKPRQSPQSPVPSREEVEASRAQQLSASAKPSVSGEDSATNANLQTASLQGLIQHASQLLHQQPDHEAAIAPQLPPPEPQPELVTPRETQPEPFPLVEPHPQPDPLVTEPLTRPARLEPQSPTGEGEHRDVTTTANDGLQEPIITLSCGPSYAAAMDTVLECNDSQADENASGITTAGDGPIDTPVLDVIDDEDDMPLAARKRKASSHGKRRKRPRSSSGPAGPRSPSPPFPCEECDERFRDRLALAAHQRQHGDTESSCGECRKTFTHPLALRRHKLHHGQTPKRRTGRRRTRAPNRYLDSAWGELGIRRDGGRSAETVPCGVCDEALTPEDAWEHLSPPPGAGFYRCAQCGRAFGQQCQLSRHGCRRFAERPGKWKGKKDRDSSPSTAAEAEGNDAESVDGDVAQSSDCDWEPEQSEQGAEFKSAAATDEAATTAAGEGDGAGRLTCDICQINFVSRRNLQRHRAQHEDGTRYSCEVCEQSYARIDDLTHHTRSVHNQKRQFRCPRCTRMFTQKRIVEYHLRTHRKASQKSSHNDASKHAKNVKTESNENTEIQDPPGPGPMRYTCEHCGAGFDTLRRYKRHLQLRHGAEPPRYECEVCDASYARIDELTRHSIQIHGQKKTIPCPRCSRFFTQQRIVDYHVKGHDTKRVYMKVPRPYRCKECQRAFSTEALLAEHDCRSRTSGQRCVCDICGRGISCPQALKRHRLQHSEERPAKCETCGAAFIDDVALSKHLLTHSEEKPYLCDHCGKGFRFKDYLVRHTRFHTGEKPYPCSVCDKRFATSDTLNRHFLIHTGEKPFVCKICTRPFRQAQQLKTHMKVHRNKTEPLLTDIQAEPLFTDIRKVESQEAQAATFRVTEVTGADGTLVGLACGDVKYTEVMRPDVPIVEVVEVQRAIR